MTITSTPSTNERHTTAATIVVLQHMYDHNLGAFLAIQAPSTASPHLDVSIPAANIDAWVASGFNVVDVELRPAGVGPINGAPWETVVCYGALADYGLRLRLKYSRAVGGQADPAPVAAYDTDQGCMG